MRLHPLGQPKCPSGFLEGPLGCSENTLRTEDPARHGPEGHLRKMSLRSTMRDHRANLGQDGAGQEWG